MHITVEYGSLNSDGGAIGRRNGKNFVQAYEAYWNEEEDDLFAQGQKVTSGDFSHELYTQYMSSPTTSKGKYLAGLEERRKSEWTIFQAGYYSIYGTDLGWYSDEGFGDIIEFALQFQGYPYVWGAKGPNSFDCSGFVLYCYNHFGISVPSCTADYRSSTKEIPWEEIQPGDILIRFAGEGGHQTGHAGIYMGDGQTIEAMGSQYGVCIGNAGEKGTRYFHVFRYYEGETLNSSTQESEGGTNEN